MITIKKPTLQTLESIIQFLLVGYCAFAGGVLLTTKPQKKKPSFVVVRNTQSTNGGEIFEQVVMHPSLRKRMEHLAHATAKTKSHQGAFRNILLYGPPGTGKTMAARDFARKTGLDYCHIDGGDVAPLGSSAWSKIHQVFNSGETSKNGLLIVIDNADVFLQSRRTSTSMSEAQRNAVNALLSRTGDLSRNVALVLATNRPGDLDSAVIDRIDDAIEFPLPDEEERYKLFKSYLKISDKDSHLDDKVIRDAARKTCGFSGREIAKLVVAAVVYVDPQCDLESQLFEAIMDLKIEEHNQKARVLTNHL